jgi:glycosyltransferase involved in cell wall biosynthesis
MISAIIPTLNAGKNIDNLLTSLENQSVPCEIIVIDSSSSDRTLEIAASHNVKTITIKRTLQHPMQRGISLHFLHRMHFQKIGIVLKA